MSRKLKEIASFFFRRNPEKQPAQFKQESLNEEAYQLGIDQAIYTLQLIFAALKQTDNKSPDPNQKKLKENVIELGITPLPKQAIESLFSHLLYLTAGDVDEMLTADNTEFTQFLIHFLKNYSKVTIEVSEKSGVLSAENRFENIYSVLAQKNDSELLQNVNRRLNSVIPLIFGCIVRNLSDDLKTADLYHMTFYSYHNQEDGTSETNLLLLHSSDQPILTSQDQLNRSIGQDKNKPFLKMNSGLRTRTPSITTRVNGKDRIYHPLGWIKYPDTDYIVIYAHHEQEFNRRMRSPAKSKRVVSPAFQLKKPVNLPI